VTTQARSLPIPDGLDGLRLDVAVARLFGLSRTAAADLLEAGSVTLDGRDGRKSDRVTSGAWIEVALLVTADAAPPP
jgi:23S rRNA pseudouridine1911/1915/1917 synthase